MISNIGAARQNRPGASFAHSCILMHLMGDIKTWDFAWPLDLDEASFLSVRPYETIRGVKMEAEN